ncbi:MAG: glycoside hydrolase family 38 C-terminal domain-containing protein [Verrucomicrobiota bacterium]
MHFPKTHHLQIYLPRLKEASARIEKAIWCFLPERIPLDALPSTSKHVPYRDVDFSKAKKIESYPHDWGRMYEQRWFTLKPKSAYLKEYSHLFWKDEAEATLYIDGAPYAGFDPGHLSVPLPQQFNQLVIESSCIQTGIWVPGASDISESGSHLQGAYLAKRHEAIWQLSIDFELLLELALYLATLDGYDKEELIKSPRYRRPLDRLNPQARLIFSTLDRVVNYFDLSDLNTANTLIAELYDKIRHNNSLCQVVLTGHAHLDLVWLWPERVGEFKAIHSLSNACELMRRYPEFTFGYSQTASYDAVAKRSTELHQQIQEYIHDKRWEALGAMEVESDTHMPCGEALTRCLFIGQKKFAKLTGKHSEVVWLPDTFGFSGCFPAIAKECGAKYFYTTKQGWSNATQFPYSSFIWRGNDGTEIIAHVLHSLLINCYNTTVGVHEVAEATSYHKQSDIHPEVLLPVGYGDGGGGPNEKMCERARRLKHIHGVPSAHWGSIADFFKRMDKITDRLPLWHGEIYLEYHRGIFTTHAALKQAYRHLERCLQILELIHALKNMGPVNATYWERLVFAQFHDYLPGSSIHEVYEEAIPELNEISNKVEKESHAIFKERDSLLNPFAYELTVCRVIEDISYKSILPPLASQKISDFMELEKKEKPTRINELSIKNDRVRASFNHCGEIVALHFDDQAISIKNSLNQLCIYPDHPSAFKAWDIDRNTIANEMPLASEGKLIGCQQENDSISLSFDQPLTEQSSVKITYKITALESVLRIIYVVDWRDENLLLKTLFPTNYTGKNARYGAPFGSTLRAQLQTDIASDAQFEVPASRWAIVTDDCESEGLAVIAKDRYGFGCQDGTLHTSLLRSAKITSTDKHLTLRKRSYQHHHSDIGIHTFELALAWGGQNVIRSEQPAALADHLFTKPILSDAMASIVNNIEGGNSLIPSWIKPLDHGKGFILRLHETRGKRGICSFALARGWKMQQVSLDENSLYNKLEDHHLSFTPYSVISLKLTLSD